MRRRLRVLGEFLLALGIVLGLAFVVDALARALVGV